MLRYFKVSVKKKMKNKGIITNNSKKGSIIVKRVIPEVQLELGLERWTELGDKGRDLLRQGVHHQRQYLDNFLTTLSVLPNSLSLFHCSLCFSLTKENALPFDLTFIPSESKPLPTMAAKLKSPLPPRPPPSNSHKRKLCFEGHGLDVGNRWPIWWQIWWFCGF